MIKTVLRTALFLGLAVTALAGTAQAGGFGERHGRGYYDHGSFRGFDRFGYGGGHNYDWRYRRFR